MELTRFTELCEKHYSDSLTQQEREELNFAIEVNEEFRAHFEEFGKLFSNLQLLKEEKKVKGILAEADLEMEIQSIGNTKVIIPIRTRLFHYATIAAVTILSVLGTLYLSNWFSYKKHIQAYTQLGNNITVLTHYQKSVWDELFNNNEKSERSIIAGTGFALSPEGYIVTSYHLVKDFDSIFVVNKIDSTLRYHADLIYMNESSDVAFLKINDTTFTSIENIPYTFYKKSNDLGEYVYTLGYSKQDLVFGEGSISSLTGFNEDSLTIQISIPSNPGNSGGPLLNSKGEIVGMLLAKNYEKEGATYAIKSELLLSLIDSLNTRISDDKITIPKRNSISGIDRPKQINKIRPAIFRVEAY
jgi:S1-C subfamily serine protease